VKAKLPKYKRGTVVHHWFRVPDSRTRLSVFGVYGDRPGPTLLVHAAIHGNELVGIQVVLRLLELFSPGDLSGNLLLVPVVNVPAFEWGSRVYPNDDQDMNRVFPGHAKGTLTERLAHIFFQEIGMAADAILDLHSTEYPDAMVPHVRVRVANPTKEHWELLLATGLGACWTVPGVAGMLQVEAERMGTPCVTVEIGTSGTVQQSNVDLGLRVATNVMKSIGLLPGKCRVPRSQVCVKSGEPWVLSPVSGLFESCTRPGKKVRQGQLIGQIVNIGNAKRVEIQAPHDGLVFSSRIVPQVSKGSRLALIIPLDSQHTFETLSAANSIRVPNRLL